MIQHKLILILLVLLSFLKAYPKDIILVCNQQFQVHDSLICEYSKEYYFLHGFAFIQKFYPNHQLKSESFWSGIDQIYEYKKFSEDGTLLKTIDKRVGDYDFCFFLAMLKEMPEDSIIETGYYGNSNWYVITKSVENQCEKYKLFNTQTGKISYYNEYQDEFVFEYIGEQPNIEDILPSFPGGQKELLRYVRNYLDNTKMVIEENKSVSVRIYIDEQGKVSNPVIYSEVNDNIKQMVFDMVAKMPDWIPPKSGRSSSYTIPILIRKFE